MLCTQCELHKSCTFLGLFQRKRKYNVPVHICGHPELNQYIRCVVDDVKPLLEAGQVDYIAVPIKSKVSVFLDHAT